MTDKYQEALQRAKEQYGGDKENLLIIKDTLEKIFPELAEGEDERIRKEMIEHFKSKTKDTWCNMPVKSILAWLEKQKEQKPVEIHEPSGVELDRHQKELYDFKVFAAKQAKEHHISFVHDFEWNNFCVELLSYFNEQKTVEIHIDNPNIQKFDPDVKVATSDSSADGKELLYVSNKSYNIGYRDGVASAKQEWSEEDKETIEMAIETLEHEDYLNLSERLKSLRPQPKQEWSKEDEKLLDKIEAMLDSYCDYLEAEDSYYIPEVRETISRLKSLRPQSKQEWSKEDERHLRLVTALLQSSKEKCLAGFYRDVDESIAWLQSLRPQPKDECGKTKINGEPISSENQSVNIPLPEWSEEDEEALDMCLDAIPKRWKTKSGILLTKWLKDNIHPQPKQEWSEEDKALLKEIVSFFKDGTVKLQHDLDLYAGFLENKFKSLRPQPHWKPSEEQTTNLLRAEGRLRIEGESVLASKLAELYEQLKKLM